MINRGIYIIIIYIRIVQVATMTDGKSLDSRPSLRTSACESATFASLRTPLHYGFGSFAGNLIVSTASDHRHRLRPMSILKLLCWQVGRFWCACVKFARRRLAPLRRASSLAVVTCADGRSNAAKAAKGTPLRRLSALKGLRHSGSP